MHIFVKPFCTLKMKPMYDIFILWIAYSFEHLEFPRMSHSAKMYDNKTWTEKQRGSLLFPLYVNSVLKLYLSCYCHFMIWFWLGRICLSQSLELFLLILYINILHIQVKTRNNSFRADSVPLAFFYPPTDTLILQAMSLDRKGKIPISKEVIDPFSFISFFYSC